MSEITEGTAGNDYAAEAKERWGQTDTYKESARRTQKYGAEDWAAIKGENEQIEADFAEALATGLPSDSPEVTALAERARLHIDRWFYPCPPAMHSGLAAMYTADPRFKENYENRAEGLADYVAAAIVANEAQGDRA
jgi:hypothetical protein